MVGNFLVKVNTNLGIRLSLPIGEERREDVWASGDGAAHTVMDLSHWKTHP